MSHIAPSNKRLLDPCRHNVICCLLVYNHACCLFLCCYCCAETTYSSLSAGIYVSPIRHVVIDLNKQSLSLNPYPTSCAGALSWAYANGLDSSKLTIADTCTFYLIPYVDGLAKLPDANEMFDSCRHECPGGKGIGFETTTGSDQDYSPPGDVVVERARGE